MLRWPLMNGIGTQKTIKMMKHYHRNISRTDRLKYPSVEYFREKLRELDPKPGECFALFLSKDNFRGIILIEKPVVSGWTDVSFQYRAISINRQGFQRLTGYLDFHDMKSYSDIVQIDPHRFHVLDKQIAMMNVQLNCYKAELEEQLTNPFHEKT